MKKILLLLLLWPLMANAQNDTVGIFMENNGVKKEIIPIRQIKTKTNMLGSALTYGIASSNIKVIFSGNSSNNIANKNSIFYFYFPTQCDNEYMANLFNNPTMSISGSPRNFGLARLKVKSKTRELSFAKINVWSGTSAGVDMDLSVFKTEKIKNNVYKLSFCKDIAKGEYAFVYISPNGSGVFFPIYDFSFLL